MGALAARQAAKRHPDQFGVIDDWQTYQNTLAEEREQYEAAKADINFGVADLIIDHDAATSDERERGLCRVSFRNTGGAVALGHNWQQRLIDWQLAKPNKAAA